MKWVTADTHFDHTNMIKYQKRPFENVGEMNESMVEAWNETVARGDLVYHLGDFGWNKKTVEAIRPRLNGQIVLIQGNHDHKDIRNLSWAWVKVVQAESVKENGIRIYMSHYAHRIWPGDVHLYGHSHGNLRDRLPRSMDVGVDVCGLGRKRWSDPLPLGYCASLLIKDPPPWSIDHHRGEDEL